MHGERLRNGDHTDTLRRRAKLEFKHMKIGITLAFNHLTAPSYIADAARFIEEAGFHSVWVPEHVLFFPTTHRAIPMRKMVVFPETLKAYSIHSRR